MYGIVSHQRSGTHWLLSLLRSHPACFGIGEALNGETTTYNYYTFLGTVAASDPDVLFPRRQIAGWKAYLASLPIPKDAKGVAILHYNQIELLPNHLLASILANTGLIHLVRENILRTIVSDHAAHLRKSLAPDLAQPGAPIAITLPVESLVPELERRAKQIADWRDVLATTGAVEVTYEQLLADTPGECRRILAALDWPQHPLTTARQRMTALPLEEILVNYYDVAEALRDTRFAPMVDS